MKKDFDFDDIGKRRLIVCRRFFDEMQREVTKTHLC